MEEKKKYTINFSLIKNTLINKKGLFLKVWAITFILSCIWILPQPRYYTTKVSIVPESKDSKDMGSIASLASNFGVNLSNGSSDAIYPQLYPDLFKSTEFLVGLLDIQIKTKDGKINTDYYTYMKDLQKKNYLLLPFETLQNWIKSIGKKEEKIIPGKNGKRFNPFQLSKETDEVLKKITSNINCTYSRTTEVVTISITDQDPLTCALLADSIKEHLQVFITDYRTNKARHDYEYYKKLTADAKKDYEKARRIYGTYSDANTDLVLTSYRAKVEDLENDMQLKYNTYSTMCTQLEAAKAKVLERTPAFTVIKGADVPVKPAGPKRMLFVAGMLLLTFIGTSARILLDKSNTANQ